MKKFFLCILVSGIITSMSGCHQETAIVRTTDNSLNAQQAKELYESRMQEVMTKSSSADEKVNLFYRESYIPDWNRALSTRTEYVESVDVPVTGECDYYVMSNDGQGFYLTGCHHSITVVRSVESETTGVYHHFYIPFRDSRDTYRESFKGELYRGFHNNGYRDGFSGLEIYANTKGEVVKILRYYKGRLYDKFYSGNGKKETDMIRYTLKYYITKGYGIRRDLRTRDGSQYSCPQCGHQLNEYNGYYYCSECGWDEMDFWEQDLEECYIYGEGGGSGSGNDGGNPGPNYPDPDPNTGSGGSPGNGTGTEGNIQGEIPAMMTVDSLAISQILPTIQTIMNDCAGETLINSISDLDIRFQHNPRQSEIAKLIPTMIISNDTTYYYTIYYNIATSTISERALFEDLYHCLQKKTGHYDFTYLLNVEIEAKYATFLYLYNKGSFSDVPGYDDEKQCLIDYRENPTSQNYLYLIDYVRNLRSGNTKPYYNFPESPDYRHMYDIESVFSCY